MKLDAVTVEEESALVKDIERWFVRKRYDSGHFDKVITQYREIQKPLNRFCEENQRVLLRVRDMGFPSSTDLLPVHILDLAADGEIGPHVDHIEYSGRAIVGLSLLTNVVMTLRHQRSDAVAHFVLPRRSLYIMADEARYNWSHAIGRQTKGRRVSLIFRDRAENEA